MSRFAFAAVLGATAMASADFAGASFTEEVINPGEVTYKIFLNYTNPLDKQLAVSGNANYSALELTASSPLIQKHLVEAVPADVPGPLALPGDSWVTIGEGLANGGETQFSPGFLAGQGDAFGALISGDGFVQATVATLTRTPRPLSKALRSSSLSSPSPKAPLGPTPVPATSTQMAPT